MKKILLDELGLQDYLFEVQEGNVSLRRAANEIYNYLQKEIWTITLFTPSEEVCEQKGIDVKKIFTPKGEIRRGMNLLAKEFGLPGGTIGLCGITSRSRTVGYFFSKEEAFETIQEEGRGPDYNELGYYNYVIVENYRPGAWCEQWPKHVDKRCERYFFNFNYDDQKYHLLEAEPDWAKQTCNYGIG